MKKSSDKTRQSPLDGWFTPSRAGKVVVTSEVKAAVIRPRFFEAEGMHYVERGKVEKGEPRGTLCKSE